jgi:hypothetical protein
MHRMVEGHRQSRWTGREGYSESAPPPAFGWSPSPCRGGIKKRCPTDPQVR